MNMRNIGLTTAAASLVLGSLGFALVSGADMARADTRLVAQSGQANEPAPAPRQRGARLAAAATELGVSEAELRAALGLPEQPIQPDFAGAAAQLGTTETELRTALRNSRQGNAGPRGRRPDFATVAEQFGVTEAELLAALGVPAERPSPDLAAAAQQLGVSEAELRTALEPDCSQGTHRQGRSPGAGFES